MRNVMDCSIFMIFISVTIAIRFVIALQYFILSRAENIAAFYHASVTNDGRHNRIIQSQIDYLNSSGVLSRLNAVYYGVIHPLSVKANKKLRISNEKFFNIGYWYGGQEMKTLSKLFDFCNSNPAYKVLYFHMKGGSNPLLRNQQARRVLDIFTLNPSCIDALDKYDTCGWRLSPIPYIHYSGNFWWARCTYINTLIDPKTMIMDSPRQVEMIAEMMTHYSQEEQQQDFIKAKMKMEICVGLGRFFGEAWLGSGTFINGADCLPENSDPNFIMYGESVPPFLPLAEDYKANRAKMVNLIYFYICRFTFRGDLYLSR